MKPKRKKIKRIIITGFIIFSNFILLFIFLMQIVLLNKFYEIYKTKQLEKVEKEIISNVIVNNNLI